MSRQYRQGTGFARPENTLKRAEELENVGQRQAALQALHDVLTNRKNKTWSKTFENIMFKHIDLCVEMKKRNYAKEALMQYRNMCQSVNINSLEEVIKYLLKKAGDKAEEAKSKAAAVTIDMGDLEEDASPEDIMLSYVSVEKSKDRTDRELVTPWFRFLWETFRSILEILRTNPKLEGLYVMTAARAFQFCAQYKRTAEFRRLCDILRQHLSVITNRHRESQPSTASDSFQVHLEARFEQLKVACEMELWAEAFRTVEDIQNLIAVAKKTPKQQMMATYYARLTQILSVSDSHIYHAYAWLKLFNFSRTYNRNLSSLDLQQMACSVLLSTLSILPYERVDTKHDDLQAEFDKDRIIRMANILGFTVDSKKDYRNVLSRSALLGSMASANILSLVPADIRAIFELLTADFSPLELCTKLAPLLEKLNDFAQPMSTASPVKEITMAPYVAALKRVAVLRTLKQLSEVYSTVKISFLASLIPFLSFADIEAFIVDAVKFEFLQIRIDHRNGIIHFGSLQVESDKIRNHISLLAKRFSKALHMVNAEPSEEKQKKKEAAIQAAMEQMPQEHKRAAARKIIIEKRKEEAEKEVQEAEREEERRRKAALMEAEAAEERRRREEVLRREKERLERELEEKELEEAKQLLEARKKAAGKGGLKEGEKLDKKALMAEALTERLKEQQEFERKLTKLAKSMDHLERARREEEVPFLMEAYTKRVANEREHHEAEQALKLEKHQTAWDTDIVEKRRLWVMLEDKEAFQAMVMSRREEEFKALQVERERRLAEKRAARRAERMVQRRKEFVRRCRAQVEARVNEIKEEARLAEEARRKAEEAEKRKKLDEAAEKQRVQLEEIERKRASERAAAPPAAATDGGERKYVPPSQRSERAAPPSGEDRWARGRQDDRREDRREDGGGDRWPARRDDRDAREPPRDAPRESREAPPAAAAAAPAKYVPPKRNVGDQAPPSSSGSAYRPPNRR